jgi:triosephosphate isomerase
MKRRPLIAANWKMNHTPSAAAGWCNRLKALLDDAALTDGVELAVAPPAPALPTLAAAARDGLPMRVSAQNMHHELSGAFTGEISAPMLKDIDVTMVILGHSERRHVFGETDELIGRKVARAVAEGLVPILCVGEKEDERESDRTETVVENQLRRGLADLDVADLHKVVIAYEPVWAIGTGKVATVDQADEAHAFVRSVMGGLGSAEVADGARVLYGGSVKPNNAGELAARENVDGFLIGGASLEADSFVQIARAAAEAKGIG